MPTPQEMAVLIKGLFTTIIPLFSASFSDDLCSTYLGGWSHPPEKTFLRLKGSQKNSGSWDRPLFLGSWRCIASLNYSATVKMHRLVVHEIMWCLFFFGWTEICASWLKPNMIHCSPLESCSSNKKCLSNENFKMHFRKRLQNCPTRRMALKSSGWPTPPPPFKNQLLCLGWVPFGTQKLAASNAKNHSFLPSESGKISRKHTILIGYQYKWLMLRGFPLQIRRFFWAQKWAQQIR